MSRDGSFLGQDGESLGAEFDDLLGRPGTNHDMNPLQPGPYDYDVGLLSESLLSEFPAAWNDLHFFPGLDLGLAPAQAIQQPGGVHPRKKRGKTYIGCFTCKQRKIKCDERRPVCRNCERSRYHSCRGYLDHDSNNASVEDASTQQPRKRARRAGAADAYAEEQDPQRATPRSMFSSDTFFAEDLLQPDRPSVESPLQSLDATSQAGALVQQQGGDEPPTPLMTPNAPESDTDLIDHYRDVVCHIMMPTVDVSRNPWLQLYLPLALTSPPTKTQLALRHALLSVSAYHKMQSNTATSARDRVRAESHKLEASRLLNEITTHSIHDLDTAEKCSLLAAAMTLITVGVFSGDRSDCHADLELAKLILQRTGGDPFWKSHLHSSILLQIFRCYDMVASTMKPSFWEDADRVDSDASFDDHVDPCEDALQNHSQPLAESRSNMMSLRPQEFPYTQHYILDISFGIGLGTISALNRIIRLARVCSEYDGPSSWPEDLRSAVDALETQLYETEANPTAFKRVAGHDTGALNCSFETPGTPEARKPAATLPSVISDELLENHQWAFHYAVILFLHRSVQPSPFKLNASRLKTAQNCVNKVLDRLENIDSLTRGPSVRSANTLWPAFTAACEAVEVPLRHRALIWFARAGKRGIGNISAAKESVMEVWRRVDRLVDDEGDGGLGPVDWREVMKDLEWKIMLT
ncbi:hypothetical protein K491DRAFT_723227 [Lophiostoma macrostomum CBS 122681]|uniref:Zn(2)-C6 fungal-type domain-containing protein n=1 Tax=Lophiostoma macrostomum CBS 122681 TaxID=1314788 RepID=A0A6A6SII8_9PLEO|nr:hypothetical protein K491DRAFT_723227 [Lophiostoma macrostomum CBS 122681]